MHFLLSGLSIILIDLLLAGDNALVIAMAVRSLPLRDRRLGIAGEMILSDPSVIRALQPGNAMRYSVEAGLILVLLIAGNRIGAARLRQGGAVS